MIILFCCCCIIIHGGRSILRENFDVWKTWALCVVWRWKDLASSKYFEGFVLCDRRHGFSVSFGDENTSLKIFAVFQEIFWCVESMGSLCQLTMKILEVFQGIFNFLMYDVSKAWVLCVILTMKILYILNIIVFTLSFKSLYLYYISVNLFF